MKNGKVVGTARTADVSQDDVLGMIISGNARRPDFFLWPGRERCEASKARRRYWFVVVQTPLLQTVRVLVEVLDCVWVKLRDGKLTSGGEGR